FDAAVDDHVAGRVELDALAAGGARSPGAGRVDLDGPSSAAERRDTTEHESHGREARGSGGSRAAAAPLAWPHQPAVVDAEGSLSSAAGSCPREARRERDLRRLLTVRANGTSGPAAPGPGSGRSRAAGRPAADATGDMRG